MTEDAEGRQRKHRRLWLALAAVLVLLAVLIVPPLVSINHLQEPDYESDGRIPGQACAPFFSGVAAVAQAGLCAHRPERRRGPGLRRRAGASRQYGHAYYPAAFSVAGTAGDRPHQRGRGQPEPGAHRRRAAGTWIRFSARQPHTAGSAQGSPGRRAVPLPYLEATNSRINIKSGAEKLPFSLVDTELSFWQEEPGEWRIQLRGQPARTDVSLELADTGVVRLEASVHRAPELRQMPVHLDLDWREAQLGQLTRLVIGSDPGWRGDLTGELHLDGTAEAAQVKTRLRATGVHRAEFAPAAPMDFDANCGFVYHYSSRALEQSGLRLSARRWPHPSGRRPAGRGGRRASPSSLTGFRWPPAWMHCAPSAAVLAPGLEARGTISGKIAYDQSNQKKTASGGSAKAHPPAQGPFTGSLTVDGFQLSGDALRTPIRIPR